MSWLTSDEAKESLYYNIWHYFKAKSDFKKSASSSPDTDLKIRRLSFSRN